jgi:hypothetical protein
MAKSGMVGLMGLTLFCNKCVEVFYNFANDGKQTDELRKVCQNAIYSFKSLAGPVLRDSSVEKLALFDTNEEITSFEQALSSDQENVNLINLIRDLEIILDEGVNVPQKKEIAEKLQRFFDMLGDYSFYATNDCLKGEENTVGA